MSGHAYRRLSPFCGEGLARAQDEDGSFLHIRLDGTPAYKERYDAVGGFQEGLARVRKGEDCFHIRPDGTPAYRERFDFVGNFLGDRTFARRGGRSFHIRPDGSVAVDLG